MWGLFIGIAIGILQMLTVYKLGNMILRGKTGMIKALGGVLLLIQMALIILILYLISTISIWHLIWAAGGMLLGLIAASLFMYKRRRRA